MKVEERKKLRKSQMDDVKICGAHATTWVNLEDVMLSEISQTQKDN